MLVKKFNPLMDKIMDDIASKIPLKIAKRIVAFVTIFLLVDCILTCYAQDIFITRLAIKNDILLKDMERREDDFQKLQQKDFLMSFVTSHWDDGKMIRTFPNMKVEDVNGNIIYLDSLLPEIQPYYKKVFEK